MADANPTTASRAEARAAELARRYRSVRSRTEVLCGGLEREDYVAQSMPDASPAKWHLAHTSWFFETFVLKAAAGDYAVLDPQYEVLFNSYYNAVGEQHPRPERGLLTRPTVEQVYAYRHHVDGALLDWLGGAGAADTARLDVVELGLHHEQQHQELLLTDLGHLFSLNPLRPSFGARIDDASAAAPPEWRTFAGGAHEIGHAGDAFAFDNEKPRHRV